MGEIVLRRRLEPTLKVDVYEVKLGDEFLMSSLFTVAEVELARLGLAQVAGDQLDVLVGGLGLGYTAMAALVDDRVQALTVIETIPAVIDWHARELLPETAGLATDLRTRLIERDFFLWAAAEPGLVADVSPAFDAILLDIDHTPGFVLHPSHAAFYTQEGLTALQRHLKPGGVFALWSDDPPDEDFISVLASVFKQAAAHVVSFPNPLTGGESANTVYVAA